MQPSPVLSIVIPAYNEATSLPPHLEILVPLLNSVIGDRWEVLVVDDGSTDQTVKVIESLGYGPRIRVLRSAENRGKGAALRRGVAESQGAMVLTCDADMSTPPEMLLPFLSALEQGADIVIGTRRSPEAKIARRQPWVRRFLGTGYLTLCRKLTGVRLSDFNCGFKLFRGETARELMAAARIDGWAIDMETLALAGRRHLTVRELPVSWSDSSRSAVRLARDVPATLREMFRIWCHLRRGTGFEAGQTPERHSARGKR